MKHTIRKIFSHRRIFTAVIALIFFSSFAQETKPFKTGLVLSGGGAKGLAHIGLLQLMDSLEIQVDYITGTSMGSILAGFYSLGYSGDSINEIISGIDWEYVLTNNLPLTRVHINEKDYFSNYHISLPIKNHRPTIPGSFVEGQHLSELLGKYMFPARNINDFHQLPIPLEVIAADILSGKKVILKSGSLPSAIRASMAIPAFFAPVALDDYLLVDGGIQRNFPVEEVRNMGADFVVGSYTGFRKMSDKEIESAIGTVYQLFALDAVDDAEKMKEQTDVLLDFTDALKNYATQSFDDHQTIIEIGKRGARKLLPQLIELKRKQVEAGIRFEKRKISEKQVSITNINTFSSSGENLPEAEHRSILAIIDTTSMEKLDSVKYLSEGVKRLFSHLDYTKIHATFSPDNESGKELNVFFKKAPPALKLSLHYDTYESAGIVLRYDRRDAGLPNSRLSVSVDLSQYFKANAYYLKYLNHKKNTWMKLLYDFRRQKSNDLIFKMISQTMFLTDPSMLNNYHSMNFSVGYSPSMASSITAGIEYKSNRFSKEVGAFGRTMQNAMDSTRTQSLYAHSHLVLFLKYNRNTLNSNLFPTRGNKLETGVQLFFNNRLKLHQPPAEDNIATEFYSLLNPENFPDSVTAQNPVLQFWINEKALFPVSRKVSIRLHAFAGFNFTVENGKLLAKGIEDYAFLSQKFNMGGYHNYSFDDQVPFPSISVNELKINTVSTVTLGVQWKAWKKMYVTPNIGLMSSLSELLFSDRSENFFIGWGAGIDLDYMSIIGPMKLSVNFPRPRPDVFFSLGYQF